MANATKASLWKLFEKLTSGCFYQLFLCFNMFVLQPALINVHQLFVIAGRFNLSIKLRRGKNFAICSTERGPKFVNWTPLCANWRRSLCISRIREQVTDFPNKKKYIHTAIKTLKNIPTTKLILYCLAFNDLSTIQLKRYDYHYRWDKLPH